MTERVGIIIRTHIEYWIQRSRLDDDPEMAPGLAVIGAYVNGKLIARAGLPPEWDAAEDNALFRDPRAIQYMAVEPEPNQALRAELFAIVPVSAIPSDEPWVDTDDDEDDGSALITLGVVLRLPEDRSSDRSFEEECVHHLHAILGGNAKPAVDRALDILLG